MSKNKEPSAYGVKHRTRRPSQTRKASASQGDDLTLIKGIGPAIQTYLHDAGILTFAQLGASSPEKIAANVTALSAKRIAKENWIGQARKLASKRAPVKSKRVLAVAEHRQHYATFTVELLLDKNNDARRTRVVHVQSGDVDTWAGWEAERLIDFLARHTAARSRVTKPVPPAVTPKPVLPAAMPLERVQPIEVADEPVPQVPTVVGSAPPASVTAEQIPSLMAAEPAPEVAAITKSAPLPTTPSGLAGALGLRCLEAIPTNTNKPRGTLSHDQVFQVRLNLDLTKVTAPGNPPLNYKVSIYAKSMSGEPRRSVGEAQGILEFAESTNITVDGATLPQGLYRLEAAVILSLALSAPSPRPGLTAWLEGGLLQVY